MIEAAMVSTPEGCINNSPVTPNPYASTKNHSARKPLRPFTKTFYAKHNTTVQRFDAAKAKRK